MVEKRYYFTLFIQLILSLKKQRKGILIKQKIKISLTVIRDLKGSINAN